VTCGSGDNQIAMKSREWPSSHDESAANLCKRCYVALDFAARLTQADGLTSTPTETLDQVKSLPLNPTFLNRLFGLFCGAVGDATA
jgi:hypothetical protein